jgi:hypothetical protein
MLWLAAALLLTLALGGCTLDISSLSGTTSSDGSANGTPTPTATPSPTPTVQQACRTLLNASSLQAASAGSAFTDVTFPANSLGTGVTSSPAADGRFAIAQFDVCTPASSIAAIQSFFATGLPSAGWAQSGTYPYDGALQASCGDPYCWSKDSAPRYVSLESIASQPGGYVTYHLRLATPPTPPSCQPDDYGIYATRPYDTTLPNTPALPAPPLTKDGIGSAGTNGNVTQGGYAGMCSAGSVNSINAFFTTELPKLNWSTSAPPAYFAACGMSGTLYWKDRDMFQWQTNGSAGASGTFWSFTLCHVSQ